MQRFQNYVLGQWLDGQGEETPLFNALTGAQIGAVSSAGLDFAEVLTYARQKGYALRKMTFQERGRMLVEPREITCVLIHHRGGEHRAARDKSLK